MSDLVVEPDDIDRFAARMGELSEQSRQALDYLNRWLAIDYGDGRIFVTAVEAASSIRDSLSDTYRTLERLNSDASSELRRTAQMYRATENVTAFELDRTYGSRHD
ncbi:type VII secretion target [Rhodococcus maanshanensis]|uniref:Excreted virulence factor EspC, type VII ESX diderm n=1 Tax=Rhodococcus maanshanensis TaxID=183556 RepID=A0A1H7W289_9NOCA|nr:type VII secretion target [Rhodococcus maanshanensis]SEM15127.1 Excreted virulence factor EspC, type VII ESX diderm [Rhodococcus maanshanensis]